MEGPKFVFAHILAPHPPFVFDRNGEPLRTREARKRTKNENYLNQLIFTNEKVKEMVDIILAKSNTPPVIILQSDEGPYISDEYEGDTIWAEVEPQALKDHMRILNAYHLPGLGSNYLYPEISPVNSFRVIFNAYFDAGFDILEDESYIYPDFSNVTKFIRISELVKYK